MTDACCSASHNSAIAQFAAQLSELKMAIMQTEAGMFAIRAERDYVIEEDFMKAVRKVAENTRMHRKHKHGQ